MGFIIHHYNIGRLDVSMSYPLPLEISKYFNQLTCYRPQLLFRQSSQSIVHQASVGASSVYHLYNVLLIGLKNKVVLGPFYIVLSNGKFKSKSINEFQSSPAPFKLRAYSFLTIK